MQGSADAYFIVEISKKKKMIKNSCLSLAKNLGSPDYWNLYWIIRLRAMWYYWDEITDQIKKCFLNVLISYQWEIEFCYHGSNIQNLIQNLQQNHS